MTRAALYLRVSTQDQADRQSLKTQRARLLAYAKSRGYEVADVYVDAGLSGKDTNRPDLQRLLAEAAARQFDVVLVWAVDRISRSVRDLLGLIDTLADHGVAFAAVSQDFDTADPVGVLTVSILGSFAQFERELLIERTKEGHLARVKRQDFSMGPLPFGYRKEEGRLVEVAEEAAVVRRIFRLFLRLKSRRGVARTLNAEGVLTRRGKHWREGTIKGILTNPVYTGANVYGRFGKRHHGTPRPRGQWTVVPGVREPLVDAKTWRAAQRLIGKGKPRKVEEKQEYALSGLVRCGKCGGAMCGSSKRRGTKVHRYYVCNQSRHRGKAHCTGMSVRADLLEEVVLAKARGIGHNGFVEEASPQPVGDDGRDTRNALERVKRRIARLFDLYQAGDLDKDQFGGRMAVLDGERGALQGDPAPVQDTPGAPDQANGIAEVVVEGTRARVVLQGRPELVRVSLVPECDTGTFAGRLRQWRLEQGLLQREVAETLGVNPQCVRNWEAGKTRPRSPRFVSLVQEGATNE